MVAMIQPGYLVDLAFLARDSIYAKRAVRHIGGSVKTGWSYCSKSWYGSY